MCKHKKQTQNADNDSFFHIANHRFTPFFQKKKTKTSLVLTANRTLAHRKSNQYFSHSKLDSRFSPCKRRPEALLSRRRSITTNRPFYHCVSLRNLNRPRNLFYPYKSALTLNPNF
jgi:hypothetical protein